MPWTSEKKSFIMSWMTDLRNWRESSSILKTYSWYKLNFGTECYLEHISKPKFRIALSKLRASSHDLEIEWGWYVRPILGINERLCISYHVIEEVEEHFVADCVNNRQMRKLFFEKITLRELGFANWTIVWWSDFTHIKWSYPSVYFSFVHCSILTTSFYCLIYYTLCDDNLQVLIWYYTMSAMTKIKMFNQSFLLKVLWTYDNLYITAKTTGEHG